MTLPGKAWAQHRSHVSRARYACPCVFAPPSMLHVDHVNLHLVVQIKTHTHESTHNKRRRKHVCKTKVEKDKYQHP